MDQIISNVFFKINLNQTPENIAKESKFNLEFGKSKSIGNLENYQYSTFFYNNSYFISAIKKGFFKIEYSNYSEKNDNFNIKQKIFFYSKKDLEFEVTTLVEKLKDFFFEESENNINELNYKLIEFRSKKEEQIPSLTIFSSEKNEDFELLITYYLPWNNK